MSRKKNKPSNDTPAEPPEEPTEVDNEEGPPPILYNLTDEQKERAAVLVTITSEFGLTSEFFLFRYMSIPNPAERFERDEALACLFLTLSKAKSLLPEERIRLYYVLASISEYGPCERNLAKCSRSICAQGIAS